MIIIIINVVLIYSVILQLLASPPLTLGYVFSAWFCFRQVQVSPKKGFFLTGSWHVIIIWTSLGLISHMYLLL